MKTRKIIYLIPIFLTAVIQCYSQPVFRPLAANEVPAYLKQIQERSATYKTITARFIQVRTTSMLKEPAVSKGYLYIKDADKLKWECTSPNKYAFILNKGKAATITGNEQSGSAQTKSSRTPKELGEFLLGGFKPETFTDKKKFETSMLVSNKQLKMNMVPVQKRMKAMLKQISINFDLSDYSISTIEITEVNGDNTKIALMEKKFNSPLNDSLFRIKR